MLPALTGEPFSGELAALLAAAIWSVSTFLYARTGSQAPALFLNLIKGSTAVIMLVVTVTLMDSAPPSLSFREWSWLAASGIVGISIGDSAYFAAIRRIGPGQTLLVESLAPPLTGLLALCFLHETIGGLGWCGIMLTTLGVTWVVTEHSPQRRFSLPGLGFAVLAAFCQATGIVMSRDVMATTAVTPFWAALARLGAAGIVLWTVLPVIAPRTIFHRASWKALGATPHGWPLFLLAVFLGTFLGITLQQASLKLTSAAIAQTLLSVSPLFALGIAKFLGHPISRRAATGSVVAIVGIALFFR